MTVEDVDPMAELLSAESSPVRRTKPQYVALVAGIVVMLVVFTFVLIVVIPSVANALADTFNFIVWLFTRKG